MTIIKVSNIFAEVEWKEIKNIHLTIYPPNARVHVSAPIGMTEEDYKNAVDKSTYNPDSWSESPNTP